MKLYTFIDRELEGLLKGQGVSGEFGWNKVFGETVSVGSPEVNMNLADGKSYLLEVETDDILAKLDFDDYESITSFMQKEGVEDTSKVLSFLRIAKDMGMAEDTVLYKNLTMSNVVKVYRYNSVEPYWVECDIKEGKLVHRVR